jgi:hypothetical protein
VSYLQRTEGEDLICAIYTGDMLSTTKEAMIEKVKVSDKIIRMIKVLRS